MYSYMWYFLFGTKHNIFSISERPEFEAAHPSMQPDCPADLK